MWLLNKGVEASVIYHKFRYSYKGNGGGENKSSSHKLTSISLHNASLMDDRRLLWDESGTQGIKSLRQWLGYASKMLIFA